MLSNSILIGSTLIFFGLIAATLTLLEKSPQVRSFTRRPIAYYLSLGIIGSTWTYYGFAGLIHNLGIEAFSYFIGISAMFLAAPLLLLPLIRLCRQYQLNNLADLMSFRFRSPSAGLITSILLTLSALPFYAAQFHTLDIAAQILNSNSSDQTFFITLFVLLCTVLSVHIINKRGRGTQRHQNLIAIVGVSTFIKLAVTLFLGVIATWGVFGGFENMQMWLASQPDTLTAFYQPSGTPPERVLILIFFASIVGMPHIFHMVFAGSPSLKSFDNARWGVPLLLLIMALPTLPIYLASQSMQSPLPNEFLILSIAYELNSPLLAVFTFIGGLAATCSIIVVLNLAISNMLINHLILPQTPLNPNQNIYRQLIKIRRAVVIALSCLGLMIYWAIKQSNSVFSFAMLSFSATLQFLPGIIALLYWQRATRDGFIAGLVIGSALWTLFLFFPDILNKGLNQDISIFRLSFSAQSNLWSISAAIALIANTTALLLVSWLSSMRREEFVNALSCVINSNNNELKRQYAINTPEEIVARLSPLLGESAASTEVKRATKALKYPWSTLNEEKLNRLISNVETNLHDLLGPAIAHQTMNSAFPESYTSGNDIVYLEDRLDAYQSQLLGVAGELKSVRQNYQAILLGLPIGAITHTNEGKIISWNLAMSQITAIKMEHALDKYLHQLPTPWGELLASLNEEVSTHHNRRCIETQQGKRWLNLHTSSTFESEDTKREHFILIEDYTDTQILEQELIHSERLASIGRLAAGVAHEIGNPVTGIACLAQNLSYEKDDVHSVAMTADEILNQTKRINTIVRSLMNFAHGETYAGSEDSNAIANIAHCCDEAVKLLELNKAEKTIHFINQVQTSDEVQIDEQRLIQLFINILENARDASKNDAEVLISCQANKGMMDIYIEDSGEGIAKEHIEKIFEPFFTTKDAGSGTGLGLALVYAIVDQHKGNISVTSPLENGKNGALFKVSLPIASRENQ